jgi:hypothetical protein
MTLPRDPSTLSELPCRHLRLVYDGARQAFAGIMRTENSYRGLAYFLGVHALSPGREVDQQEEHYGKVARDETR